MEYRILACCLLFMVGLAQGEVTIGDGPRSFTVGDSVTLVCSSSTGDDLEWVYASFVGEIVLEDNPPFTLTEVNRGGTSQLHMSIDGIAVDDAGVYTCRSVDSPVDKETVTLTVHEEGSAPPAGWTKPKIEVLEGQSVIEVEVGKDVALRCKGGNKDSEMTFRHDGQVITEDTRNIMTQALVDGTMILVLTREGARVVYSGAYSCLDTNYPHIEDSVRVEVIDHPSTRVEIIEPSGGHMKVSQGDSFNIKCQASQNVEIAWYHDNKKLEDQVDGFIIASVIATQAEHTSVLTKEDATLEDTGKYRCVNSNSPKDEASIEVKVLAEGGDSGFLDVLFGGAPSMMASVLIILSALLCVLL